MSRNQLMGIPIALALAIIAGLILRLAVNSGNDSNSSSTGQAPSSYNSQPVISSGQQNSPQPPPQAQVPLPQNSGDSQQSAGGQVGQTNNPPPPPPPPTNTPVPPPPPPTVTPIPPPTPVPNTPPGTVLAPGQAWLIDGVTLTLENNYLLKPNGADGSCPTFDSAINGFDLRMFLAITNRTTTTIAFSFDKTNYKATISNGVVMVSTPCSAQGSYSVAPGETKQLHLNFKGDYTPPNVTYIKFETLNLSRFANAVWQIPVSH